MAGNDVVITTTCLTPRTASFREEGIETSVDGIVVTAVGLGNPVGLNKCVAKPVDVGISTLPILSPIYCVANSADAAVQLDK